MGDTDSDGALRTEANPADFDQHNLLFKMRQELEGGHRIGLTAERFRWDLKTDLRHFRAAPALVHAYGRNEETTQRLRSVAPLKAIIGGGWSNETFGFDLSSTLSAGMLTDHNQYARHQ